MKLSRTIMGMPVTVTVEDSSVKEKDLLEVFNYFKYIDQKFSTYKEESEITQINKGALSPSKASKDMKLVLSLSEKTKLETFGFFDIRNQGKLDPSGLVKGWAIFNAANLLKKFGFKKYYVEAGGDIQAVGREWKVGIRNPFNQKQIIKVLKVKNQGVATSGTYLRGAHIYNPKGKLDKIISLTVIGPNVYEADRFATAAFAMGKKGIEFIENMKGFEGYMIDNEGMAILSSGFSKYEIN